MKALGKPLMRSAQLNAHSHANVTIIERTSRSKVQTLCFASKLQ